MPSLKALRGRIASVKSTQKITSAMKMVAASKLRRAQNQAEGARPYAERMERLLASLLSSLPEGAPGPRLLRGTGREQVHLLIPVTGDRGLAGAFNANIGRLTRNIARRLESEGKTVKILAVGRKGRDYLRREFPDQIVGDVNYVGRKSIGFADAAAIAARVTALFDAGEFDVCTVVYNRFHSIISQVPTEIRLIPAAAPPSQAPAGGPFFDSEPDEQGILDRLLPQNLAVQIYRAQLDSAVGFFGSQMTAMDNATRNAGDMIKRLTLNYNRARQANITRELIEIISGAEAV
jgi:F-type H+-transporting ATPase subunit gamma